MKKLEQGITDFKEYIDNDCYFVDKTHLISHLIDHVSKVHLITRPRRFGKTLNLSMIRYFFEAPFPNSGLTNPPNAYLFDDFSVSQHPECVDYMGQYPVITLSFKNVKSASVNECMSSIKDAVTSEFERHAYLLESGSLLEKHRDFYMKLLQEQCLDGDYAKSIKNLSAWLHHAYGKKVYILLDEYDTPLQSAYMEGYYDEIIRFIRSFMGQTFKDNPSLQQGVVIGILKAAQESIFSDFNNPAVSTVLNDAMKDCFGFTESEVEAMVEYFGISDKMDGIKEWYNGYIFGGDTVIYNPWSLVSYVRTPKDGFQPYWTNTSDNQLVKDLLLLNRESKRHTVEQLLNGYEVRKKVAVNIAFPQIKDGPEDLGWGFLLHGGYLKASEMQQHPYSQDYRIEIPNREIHSLYNNVIMGWLNTDLNINRYFLDFVQGIRDMNAAAIEDNLGAILFDLSSFYDMGGKSELKTRKRRESFYHGLVLGLLAYLSGEYRIESNKECGMGRPDIVLARPGSLPNQAEVVILFEFKQGNIGESASLDKLAQAALDEAERKYLEGVKKKWHPKEMLVLGVGFRGKELALRYSSMYGPEHRSEL